MKIRVFRKLDDTVIYDIPTARYQKEEMWNKCPVPPAFGSLERIDLEDTEIPRPQPDEEYYHEMVYFEGPTQRGNLKIDRVWERCLMPLVLIQQKQRVRWNQEIDGELSKKAPNTLKILELQREKERSQSWTEPQWYEQALRNLHEENKLKPMIRKKLQEKIEALKKEIRRDENG